jgi:carboxypeptidase D
MQKELGVRVNFTWTSNPVAEGIFAIGDTFPREGMKDLEYLLNTGVKAALAYGDRDFKCPWVGAENLSLKANWTGAEEFRAAGYEHIRTNKSYSGGVVRQRGDLSFARVFEAGHDGELSLLPTSRCDYSKANEYITSLLTPARNRLSNIQQSHVQYRCRYRQGACLRLS